MKSYELKPTDENIRDTLLNDSIGRNGGIASFIELLDNIESNSVIALDAAWGDGKTFFVKQVQLVLQGYISSTDGENNIRQFIPSGLKLDGYKRFIPIYYDAWLNDNDYDPILSIINDMLRKLVLLKDFEVSNTDWLKTFISSVDLIVKALAGPQIKDFLTTLRSDDPLSEIKKQKKLDEILNDLFDEIFKKCEEGAKIVFFVDELDRCRPDFAVKVLERIKHFFSYPNIIFVISTNIKELQHTIKRHYGDGFDACKYLTRFFDFTVTLPMLDYEKYYYMLDFTHRSYIRDDLAYYIIKYYNFSLRDITRYLQVLRIVIPERYRGCDYDDVNRFYMEILVPFLLGLKIHDASQYEEFIHGYNADSFIELMQDANVDWYCGVLLDENETFNATHNGKKLVSLKDRFYLFYNLFFGVDSRGADNPVEMKIGKNKFLSLDKKKWIMNVISFMVAKYD